MEIQDRQQENPPMGSQNSVETNVGETAPAEIIEEILLRLAVKSLLRYKSVCKSWYSLISDPKFIKDHLTLSTRSNDKYTHHPVIVLDDPSRTYLTCSLYDLLHTKFSDALELDCPIEFHRSFFSISGSCNGLLCISLDDHLVLLWNPTTRRVNKLPDYHVKPRNCTPLLVYYGFGYDVSSDDYKVVRIHRNQWGGDRDNIVIIYSLKTGNWKTIADFPGDIEPSQSAAQFSNGSVHLMSLDYKSWNLKIVSLNLEKETYGEVPQPAYDEGDGYKQLSLGILGERLCVVCRYGRNRADVWVMKVYGVKDSWTKLVSIPYFVIKRFSYWWPLCITNDGKALLQSRWKLVVYDINNSSLIQKYDRLDACTFVESLVSPYAPITP